MPATAAASVDPSITAPDLAANLLNHLHHAQFVPTLCEAARIAEHLGLVAEPVFVRDANGRITRLIVQAVAK